MEKYIGIKNQEYKSLSLEMTTFLQCKPDDKLNYVDIVILICKYIEKNDLENPDNFREIQLDEKLKTLFKYDSIEPFYYTMIRKHIQHHFNL